MSLGNPRGTGPFRHRAALTAGGHGGALLAWGATFVADVAAVSGRGGAVARTLLLLALAGVTTLAGLVVLAVTVPYAVRWARSSDQPVGPGLAAAHLALAWALGGAYVVHLVYG